ncbi:MATE family efflux transporter [Halomonas sp. OfavH-34-E]|uniref:lipopolysaccharide biosynthesis protein n=1 Tax=Halomonas sp. OfavH-34-E TaxID=2954491 RepID=UPI0020974A3A|nr:MATE family efflux transporter [Halomonas sp. OfavH-34-E]MCO7214897.1 MATE family efflux transporter [Halomonas sp. OfavH-34-E]
MYKKSFFSTLIITFFARGVAAFGALFLLIVLGQLYGADGVGVYALAQSVCLGSGILAKYGTDNALVRYVGENYLCTNTKRYLCEAVISTFFLSCTVAIVVYVFKDNIGNFFDSKYLSEILKGISIAIPAFTTCLVIAGFMKAVRKPATACLLGNGISAFLVGIIIALDSIFTKIISIDDIGVVVALSSWLVLMYGLFETARFFINKKLVQEPERFDRKRFFISAGDYFVMSLSGFIQNVVAVAVAGMLLSSHELGLFKAAERTAFLINFILVVLNAILPPRFASLYREKKLEELSDLAKKGACLGFLLALPMLLICFVVPASVLTILGGEFTDAENLLRVIALGQLINVSTGSVGFLLNMTGHERLMRNLSLISSALGIVFLYLFINIMGVSGAAYALFLTLVMQNVAALFFVKMKLGFWVLPMYRRSH